MPSAVFLCALLIAAPAKPDPAPRVNAPWLGLQRSQSDQIDLEPIPGGGFQYEDEDGGFRAIIAEDGSVTFEDLIRAEVKGTPKSASGWFDGFVDALQQPRGERGRPPPDKHSQDAQNQYARGYMETVNWGPYGPGPIMFSIGGSFGGPGARGPSKKAQRDFLKVTEAMRDGMAVRFHKKKLERAARRITADVVAIWKDKSTPLSIRKQRIFELWDDAEPPMGDKGPIAEALSEGSEDVRLRIEKAIRMLAPKGSDDAYTPDELNELNAKRRSKQRFTPYQGDDKSSKRRR